MLNAVHRRTPVSRSGPSRRGPTRAHDRGDSRRGPSPADTRAGWGPAPAEQFDVAMEIAFHQVRAADIHLWLLQERRHANHEALVEIGPDDREELDPLQQRMARVARLRQGARVEREQLSSRLRYSSGSDGGAASTPISFGRRRVSLPRARRWRCLCWRADLEGVPRATAAPPLHGSGQDISVPGVRRRGRAPAGSGDCKRHTPYSRTRAPPYMTQGVLYAHDMTAVARRGNVLPVLPR